MKGSITPAGPGIWRLWLSAGKDRNQKRLRLSKRFEGSRRAAETALRKWLNELDRGEVVRATKITFSSFFELDWSPAQKSRLRSSTLEVNKSYFDRYLRPVFGHIALSELSADPIRDHLSDLLERGGRSGRPLAPSTVLKIQTLLNQLLDAAVDRGLIGRNPAKRIPKPRPQRFEVKVLQPLAG